MIVGYLVADKQGPLTRGRRKSRFTGALKWRAVLLRPLGSPVRLFGSRAAATLARNRAEQNGEFRGALVYEVTR